MLFRSLVSISLRTIRRALLEKVFAGPDAQERIDRFDRHLPALRVSASLCRALWNVVLVVGMLRLMGAETQWAPTAWAMALAGLIIAVFGVAIPHAWASYSGERIVAAVLPGLMALRYALWPITTLMLLFDVPIRRLSGAPEEPEENGGHAKQEILHAAEEGRAEGAVDADEAHMIESVMELGETHAGEIMTPRTDIFALPADTSREEACKRVFEAGHSRVPVYENDIDNIIGMLYAKDLLAQVYQDRQVGVREIMRKCFYLPETKPLNDLLREFRARKVHIGVVLDEYGGTAGLITIEDVLEEIVGDISDEYDRPEAPSIEQIDENTVEVEGRMYVDDLNDALGLEIPEDEDYDTVAGYVFSELGYIPSVGETMEVGKAKFTILAAEERKISRLRVERLSEKAGAREV